MPKCSLKNKLLQLRVSVCVLSILCLITIIQFFSLFGRYNYAHIPIEDIKNELYTEINPNLALKKSKPDCTYDTILNSKNTLNAWDVPQKYDDFIPVGVVNGSHVPENCNPLFSVAILVTYRNRQSQLDTFLPYIHSFLRKQNLHYKIYLIEQQDESIWNKGVLYNIGAKAAMADKFPCLILHDIDLLPLVESNLYVCTKQPRHMSASIDKFRYVLTYDWLVGGVIAITSEQYKLVNGFSNRFYGWGGEDDDFSTRITSKGLSIVRYPREMSRYTMLLHQPERKNDKRLDIMSETIHHSDKEGLSTVQYRSINRKENRLFTLIGVKL
ncbi:hypothetical protein K1T71_006954 [Dendrolimus kikuchii]|uniref:Uncharacterized protein n=1 Tax=Dendrolimus kikuchii TaxID=765133 RepID=A0ACC1CZN1_9NEOP|nr:hypothetical protein K1T71_006954 [Dendrolimus kikuchii]